MKQRHMFTIMNFNRPYDILGTIMPSVDKTEWLYFAYLKKAGLSGDLGPDAFLRILE